MIIYHEVTPEALDEVKSQGIKRTSKGAKSDDTAILKTDELLDAHRPLHLQAAGLSRSNSVYGYIGTESAIMDIQDGRRISLAKKRDQNNHILLRLDIGMDDCWLSDLDKYDALKHALIAGKPYKTLLALCNDYWDNVRPLATSGARIKRPEIMIGRDVGPAAIKEVE